MALALLTAAGPAPAQSQAQPQVLQLGVCQDGPAVTAAQMEAAMGALLAGPWAMSANGTGLTLGTNQMAVSLRFDAASGKLFMEGGGGPSVPLHLVGAPLADGGGEAPFDVSAETLTPGGLSATDVEILTGCAAPARYYWTFGQGQRRSWGALMFYARDGATGFMANSAGGTRSVVMQRN